MSGAAKVAARKMANGLGMGAMVRAGWGKLNGFVVYQVGLIRGVCLVAYVSAYNGRTFLNWK